MLKANEAKIILAKILIYGAKGYMQWFIKVCLVHFYLNLMKKQIPGHREVCSSHKCASKINQWGIPKLNPIKSI